MTINKITIISALKFILVIGIVILFNMFVPDTLLKLFPNSRLILYINNIENYDVEVHLPIDLANRKIKFVDPGGNRKVSMFTIEGFKSCGKKCPLATRISNGRVLLFMGNYYSKDVQSVEDKSFTIIGAYNRKCVFPLGCVFTNLNGLNILLEDAQGKKWLVHHGVLLNDVNRRDNYGKNTSVFVEENTPFRITDFFDESDGVERYAGIIEF